MYHYVLHVSVTITTSDVYIMYTVIFIFVHIYILCTPLFILYMIYTVTLFLYICILCTPFIYIVYDLYSNLPSYFCTYVYMYTSLYLYCISFMQ